MQSSLRGAEALLLPACPCCWSAPCSPRLRSTALSIVIRAHSNSHGTEHCAPTLFAVALVFIAELLNTALEHFCVVISPQPPPIGKTKDAATAAVLIAALTACAVLCWQRCCCHGCCRPPARSAAAET